MSYLKTNILYSHASPYLDIAQEWYTQNAEPIISQYIEEHECAQTAIKYFQNSSIWQK